MKKTGSKKEPFSRTCEPENYLNRLLNVPSAFNGEEIQNATSAKTYCNSLQFLDEFQAEFCIQHPTLMHHISNGVKLGIRECQFQFR